MEGTGVWPEGSSVSPTGLVALLAEAYGLAVERISPAPRGWTGETFAAAVGGRRRVFVKVYPTALLPPTAEPALSVLVQLSAVGLGEVVPPVATTDGELATRLGGKLVVVFEHLEAERVVPFPFGGEAVGELIGRLHAASPRMSAHVVTEAFDRPYAEELWRTLDALVDDSSDDEARQQLRGWVIDLGAPGASRRAAGRPHQGARADEQRLDGGAAGPNGGATVSGGDGLSSGHRTSHRRCARVTAHSLRPTARQRGERLDTT